MSEAMSEEGEDLSPEEHIPQDGPGYPVERTMELLLLEGERFLSLCRREPYQAHGPGGQKRNRTYSAIRLTLPPEVTGGEPIHATGAQFRESRQNLESALGRIRLRLALETALHPLWKGDPPSDGDAFLRSLPPAWPPLRLPVSPEHPRLPAAALQILLMFHFTAGEPALCSRALQISTGALLRFFRTDREILLFAEKIREGWGKSKLRTR